MISREDNAGHYDIRFYHGIVPEEERKETLRHLIRSYLDFCRDRDIETWIAHGTLLGWWWNSKVSSFTPEHPPNPSNADLLIDLAMVLLS